MKKYSSWGVLLVLLVSYSWAAGNSTSSTARVVTQPAAINQSLADASLEVAIGAEDDWYPYSGRRGKGAEGIAEDVVSAAFAARGVKVSFRIFPYARCLSDVKHGRLLACFDTPRTSEVEPLFLWPQRPLFDATALIYAPAESTEHDLTMTDLLGKRIATTNNYGYGEGFDGNKSILQQYSSRDIYGLRQVIAGRIPYFACFDRVMAHLQDAYPEVRGKTKPVGVIATTPIYIAFSKTFPNSSSLLATFNEGFAEIQANGQYQAIIARWNKRYPPGAPVTGSAPH